MPAAGTSEYSSRRTIWGLALCAVFLRFLAQPPVDFNALIWLAPLPWLWFASVPESPKRSGYTILWLSGFLYWLATMQGVRLAHPAQYLGWVVLSAYLGSYTPLFVGLTRTAHRQWRWPLGIAAALVWMGLEWIRSYAFTGFSAAMLGHAMLDWPLLYQIADISGTYLVSGLIIAGAALLLRLMQWGFRRDVRKGIGDVAFGALAIAAACGYGAWRLQQANDLGEAPPLLSIATVQRDTPAIYEVNERRERASVNNHLAGSVEALRTHADIDLLVWPESMFTAGVLLYLEPEDEIVPAEAQMTPSEFAQFIRGRRLVFDSQVEYYQRQSAAAAGLETNPYFLFGVGAIGIRDGEALSYNAATLFDSKHRFRGWYGKRHLVMFGEYMPFAYLIPWLYDLVPLPQTTPGPEPTVFDVAGVQVQPSICFETMVEHVAGNALRSVRRKGHQPELLINLTNDGWFHGTAILDIHLDCTRGVAVANRRPIVVAANSGITAWIDGSGRVQKRLPKRVEGILFAEPTRDSRWSLYQAAGDWPVRPAALLCGLLAVVGWRRHRTEHRPTGD